MSRNGLAIFAILPANSPMNVAHSLALAAVTAAALTAQADSHRQSPPAPVIERTAMSVSFKIGETTVPVQVFQKGGDKPTMINVHDDENTSVEAGKVNITQYGGRLIELTHTGERLITFKLGGKKYSFDPNRVFSDAGIEATLRKHSTYSPEAHDAIRSFAAQYLAQFALDSEPVIIALHNTVDGTFSVQSFNTGGNSADDAADVHVNPDRNRFDFFYVTDQRFFDYLKGRGFNVVMQDNAKVTEDGSLSVHFSKRGVPYINVEAKLGSLSEQVEMLKAAREMLRDLEIPGKNP